MSGGSSASCATWWSTRSNTAKVIRSWPRLAPMVTRVAVVVEDRGVGHSERGGLAGLQPLLEMTWPGPARRVGPDWDRPSPSRDARLHNGWLQGLGRPGKVPGSG